MEDGPTGERWLPVVGYEEWYEVSDQGRVRSLDRWVYGRRTRWFPGRMLSSHRDGHYPQVTLAYAGKHHDARIHELVLTAFVGPRPSPSAVARHYDDDPSNNTVENLLWGTSGENRRDCVRNGTHAATLRKRCPIGHLLQRPNLVASRAKAGHRVCLACARGRAYVYRHPGEDFESIALQYYRKLMSDNLGVA